MLFARPYPPRVPVAGAPPTSAALSLLDIVPGQAGSPRLLARWGSVAVARPLLASVDCGCLPGRRSGLHLVSGKGRWNTQLSLRSCQMRTWDLVHHFISRHGVPGFELGVMGLKLTF